MNKLYQYYVNYLLIIAGIATLIYTASCFDGPAVTFSLRVVGIYFIARGVTLPAAVSMYK